MTKKEYMKPAMEVIEADMNQQILAGSVATLRGTNSSGNGTEDEDWYDLE